MNDFEPNSNLNMTNMLQDSSIDEDQNQQLVQKMRSKQALLNKIKSLDGEILDINN